MFGLPAQAGAPAAVNYTEAGKFAERRVAPRKTWFPTISPVTDWAVRAGQNRLHAQAPVQVATATRSARTGWWLSGLKGHPLADRLNVLPFRGYGGLVQIYTAAGWPIPPGETAVGGSRVALPDALRAQRRGRVGLPAVDQRRLEDGGP